MELGLQLATAATSRRLSFGSVAEQYDQIRPPYPENLLDAVLAYAAIGRGAHALEIGAGPGQATVQFARRGLRVHALEPSTEMVAIAQARLEGSGLDVTFDAVEFESAALGEERFDLIFAATSWHWLEPARRWELVRDALAPGGTLAVFWHWPLWRRSSHREALDEAYRVSGVNLSEMGPMLDATPDVMSLARGWLADAPDLAAFNEVRCAEYNWTDRLSAAQYATLLGTYGDHLALSADVRESLLAAVVNVIGAGGGHIDLPYSTLLVLARVSG
jgi:SAM-dependent methyltransferase